MAVSADNFHVQPTPGEHGALPEQQLALLARNEFPFMLQLPKEGDDLETTARKLRSLADVVGSGRSLVLTADVASNIHERKVETFAKERMLPNELAQYEEWKQETFDLPEINWVANVAPVNADSRKTYTQRAAAIDLIWRQRGTTPENAAWLTNSIPAMLPLVKAVTKLLSAQTHLQKNDPLAGLSETEVIEVQTLQTIRAIADENLARERERVRRLANSIHQSEAIIQGRLKQLGK